MRITVEHQNDNLPYHIFEAIQIFFGVKNDFVFIRNSESLRIMVNDGQDGVLCIDDTDKKQSKRDVYVFLSKVLGYESPWGCMTGIRPVKVANTLYERNYTTEDIRKHFKEFYLIRDDKIELIINTANVQKRFLEEQKRSNNYIGFYSGIPFCPTRCLYCSFTSNPIGRYKKVVDKYLDVLEEEIKGTAQLIEEKNLVIRTLYLGGGTPTSLNEEQFERYLSMLTDNLELSCVSEFSLEAGRPDSITLEKLRIARKHGVNRISINPQTMNNKTLKLIGRMHTKEQIIEAFHFARETGFENINMDIIAGLPDETLEMFENTLEEIEKLDPDSLTVHTLSIKKAANLKEDIEKQKLLNAEIVDTMVDKAENFASRLNMRPYYMYRQKNILGNHENVAYCKQGCESPYNIHIMEEDQTIMAVGAGAVTKVVYDNGRIERAFNMKSVEDYISRKEIGIERKRALLSL